MLKDLRHAVRMLLHARGWTAVVILSLALGIGANTAIFSAVNGLMLKQLAVRDPGALVRLRYAGQNDMATSSSDYGSSGTDAAGRGIRATFSYALYQQFVKDNQTMEDLFACAPIGRVNFAVDGQADVASAFVASGNFFRVLGVSATLGRTFVPEDDQPTAPPVAVISTRYWRSRFGSDPNVLGKAVQINNVPVTIVGVLPADFTAAQQPVVAEPPDIYMPIALDAQLSPGPSRASQTTWYWLQVMGRLKPGATAQQVHGNLAGVFQGTARAAMTDFLAGLPEAQRTTSINRNRREVPELIVDSGARGVYNPNASDLRAISILSGVVGLVLLIVCANVANLLLSRATARRKEISVRLSMGATRLRLVRQLLTESLLLAGVGGALGVAVGHFGKRLLPVAASQATPLDWRVLGFVLGVSLVTGLVFGIAPALRATGMNVSAELKENSRSVAGGRGFLGKSLLVVQVALSLVLLVGAGLFLQTLWNLRSVDVGFNPHNVLTFRVNPGLNRYDDARTMLLYQQLMERLRAVPGVRAVALSNPGLLSGGVNQSSIFVAGRSYAPGTRDSINRIQASASFFETMEIPLIAGRGFSEHDTLTAPRVAVINQAAARKYWPNEDPIGKRFGNSLETASQIEVVGVLRDAKYSQVREEPPPTMYVPYTQGRMPGAVFEVRTAGEPAAMLTTIRDAIRSVDANLPMMDVFTQMEQIERRYLQEKVFAQAYAWFGGLAVLLASIGLFGLMSYSVARRTNEIGIRMALGAQRSQVLGQVMRESLVLVVAGAAIGAGAAYGLGRFIESQLYGLQARDTATMVFATLLMLVVASVAGYLPARRASRVDPMRALHCE